MKRRSTRDLSKSSYRVIINNEAFMPLSHQVMDVFVVKFSNLLVKLIAQSVTFQWLTGMVTIERRNHELISVKIGEVKRYRLY
jgi:hypothetical protein